MDQHARAAGALALAVGLVSCGGRTSDPHASVADAKPPFIPHEVGAVLPVAAGFTYVGSWIYEAASHRFRRPTGCAWPIQHPDDAGSKRLSVPAFWLQETPVTNVLYAYCVKAGACPPPPHDIADPNTLPWDDTERLGLPVYVRHTDAMTYCAWAGGRLPSVTELARAAQGDAEIPGVKGMTEAVIGCALAPAGAVCGKLDLMNYEQVPSPPLYSVGAVDLDEGPWFHRDLFGATQEWTRSQGGAPDADPRFCALRDGDPDFVTFPTENTWYDVVGLATPIMHAVRSPGSAFGMFLLMVDGTERYNVGFRCAFDASSP